MPGGTDGRGNVKLKDSARWAGTNSGYRSENVRVGPFSVCVTQAIFVLAVVFAIVSETVNGDVAVAVSGRATVTVRPSLLAFCSRRQSRWGSRGQCRRERQESNS